MKNERNIKMEDKIECRMNPVKYILNELLNIFGEDLTSVILFGSRARKNYSEHSDLDIMVIVEEEKEDKITKFRMNFLKKYNKKIDLHIFTEEETMTNFENFSPLFSSLILGKKILFDKNMFFKKQLEEFVKKMKNQDIKYCEGGKVWQLKKIAKNLENSL